MCVLKLTNDTDPVQSIEVDDLIGFVLGGQDFAGAVAIAAFAYAT